MEWNKPKTVKTFRLNFKIVKTGTFNLFRNKTSAYWEEWVSREPGIFSPAALSDWSAILRLCVK